MPSKSPNFVPLTPAGGDLSSAGIVALPAAPQSVPAAPQPGGGVTASWAVAGQLDPGPVGPAGYSARLDDHSIVVERQMPFEIGAAAALPPEPTLREWSDGLAACGATAAYLFWLSLAGDRPHLGVAVVPADPAVMRRVGEFLEPRWRRFSPGNPVLDIVAVTLAPDQIRTCSRVVVPWPAG